MNRVTTPLLTAVAAFVLTLSSCKKESDSVQPMATDNNLIFVGKNLRMTSFEVNPAIDLDGDGKLDTDLTVFLRDCEKDNNLVFEKNGQLSGSNGPLACSDNETDPSVAQPSHWTYNEQTKTIHIVKDNDATDVSDWRVLDASASGLKVEISVTEPSNPYKTIMTLRAI
ncbi:hypothetical protein [Spirosoma endophyticum]|uniref:Lipocalin-like domain-containing protein n=1 Tax=Spirosoma endophyticum TaxID=662367 RepID=A0A1I1W002_9BACT|nr:hypothetical protein [Spirosoma endophyticum]SFD88349.1 hypothetical protein SAMN05216167_10862 [Spirosoma endophyticum]